MTRLPAALKLPNTYKTRAPRGVVFLCTAVGGGGGTGGLWSAEFLWLGFLFFFIIISFSFGGADVYI